MEQIEILSRLAVSLAIGLLVGLERGWQAREEESGQRAAGLRTFALVGLLGGVTGALANEFGGVLIGIVFCVFALVFAAFQWLETLLDNDISVTSAVAGMLVFMLGAFAVAGDLSSAVAGAVAMTLLLGLREPLHRWIAMLSWIEIRAVLTLAAMSFLLLPIIPDRAIDPWDVINPYRIWLLAIFITGISFAGYIAIRAFGERLGIVVMAAAGGLASSTATTLAFARLGKGRLDSARLLSAGILVANVIMLLRVLVVTAGLRPTLLVWIAPPLAAAAVLMAGSAFFLMRGTNGGGHPDLVIDNPLAVGTALKFTALLAVIMLAVELLRQQFGDIGVLIIAAISGIVDVDAVTISMARIGGGQVGLETASQAILIAIAVNTVSKAILAASVGGTRLGGIVGAAGVLAIIAAGLVMVTLWPALS